MDTQPTFDPDSITAAVGGGRVAVAYTGLALGKPDADQGAADLMPFGEPVKRLAAEIILSDLSLELDRMRALLGHGAFSSKARFS